jgi:hypothetical protein
VFDEKFIRLERSFAKEKKGEERGGPRPFIGEGWHAGVGRVSEEEAMDGQEGIGRGKDSIQRREMIPIGGAHLSVEERKGEGTLSGLSVAGPRAESGAGLEGSPAACLYIFLYFSFFCFIFSFISFATFIQINSNNFLISSNIQH